MDEYSLINSKAISEHCRKIGYKFNTEELAVLIYRNKMMSADEKIQKYQELIEKYPDMEVIERINCKHYDSVKDMIMGEIQRLEMLRKKIEKDEEGAVYSYNSCYNCNGRMIDGKNEYRDIYKNFGEVKKLIENEIQEDDKKEIIHFCITKRTVDTQNKYWIRAEYLLDENRNLKMVNIYDFESDWLDISNICLNIPTPFKKGDLLVANSKTPFAEGYVLSYDRFPFVLEYLITWDKDFQKRLYEGNHDSSDMQGPGYLISEENTLYMDNVFDYDSWEYYDGNLEGAERLLRAVSSLMKDEIGIDLFIDAYENIKMDNEKDTYTLDIYTEEGLKLAGLDEKQEN